MCIDTYACVCMCICVCVCTCRCACICASVCFVKLFLFWCNLLTYVLFYNLKISLIIITYAKIF